MDFNLSEYLSELEGNLHLSSGQTGVFGNTAFRTIIINRGQNDFIRRTRALRSKMTFPTEIGLREYDLGDKSDFLMVDGKAGVLYNNKPLKYTTPGTLAKTEGDDWMDAENGTPRKYYVRRLRLLGLYPEPDDAVTVTVNYLERPDAMSNNSDEPFNGEEILAEYAEAPLFYATWKLLMRGREVNEAMSYRGEYYKMVEDCKKDLRDIDDEEVAITPYIYRRRY